MLSKAFPATHPKSGQPTFFRDKVLAAVFKDNTAWQKLHTIRENYPLWLERIKEVERGEAVIVLRQWRDRPYRSKTTEITRLGCEDGVGIQQLGFGWQNGVQVPIIEGWYMFGDWGSKKMLAQNDGLELQDWQDWFRSHDKDRATDKSLAIIHFTKFRY